MAIYKLNQRSTESEPSSVTLDLGNGRFNKSEADFVLDFIKVAISKIVYSSFGFPKFTGYS